MDTNQSMFAYLKESCSDLEKTKIIYFGRKFKAREMFYEIERVGNFLKSLAPKGKPFVVSIALPNMPEAVFALYGTNAIGAIANLMHPLIAAPALIKNLTKTKSDVIFIYDKLYAQVKQRIPQDVKCIVCSVSRRMGLVYKLAVKSTEPMLRHTFKYDHMPRQEEFVHVDAEADAPAVYLHSGGTSGEPKTVVLSNRALNSLSTDIISSVYQYSDTSYKETDSMLMCLPIFHGFGLGVCAHTILAHAHVVLMPNFNVNLAIKFIKKYKISHIAGVPAMYRKILENKNFKGDFKCISHVFCGADKLPSELKTLFDNKLRELGSDAEICEGYGLTETTTVFSLNRPGRTRTNSQGQPLMGNFVLVVDENNKILPHGQCGELLLQAKACMTEYLDDTEATKATFLEIDGKRWLKTGDYGCVDDDDYIYFKERIKRSIKIAAVNVFPSEIEEVVNKLPEIKESCVARATINGKPHTKLFIVLNAEFTYNEKIAKKIHREIEKHISHYAIPKEIISCEELYHTAIGKVDYVRYERELENKKK
ncbi:MAG: acyl--CoA ligase [Christensenellaceae bacterium]|jgi:long-chain acyl-CoA synthetase|nr:acyl--CoA ligase [Christensenellaceae bacterium]